ncbi:hypothetical protein GGTG_13342 [Gaeumannomyces tritici R3-111a-1]|uniref:Uncharacterized protein n=1 Tax=Gaeumannomyces tritici (strain R3-111a-1) TaxID=644352 RepID=J3PIL3_GAET3|nr:hypothetical protein GGTG_13342 [Gaeumannomyces tritici R3-111a-1]EJT69074.1 hypothetical protein GGTG_13342 [Gaeumannomyces tritici R3-111a-1]
MLKPSQPPIPTASRDMMPCRFPSPTVGQATPSSRIDNEAASLATLSSSKACFIGSESHTTPSSMRKYAIHNSVATKPVKSIIDQPLEDASQADIDRAFNTILKKAPQKFLNKALYQCLRTFGADAILESISRVYSPGYQASDAKDDEDPSRPATTPIPPLNFMPTHPVGSPQTPSTPVPLQAPSWSCHLCFRCFTAQSAYEYHTSKDVCRRDPPSISKGFKHSCLYCGEGFVTAVDLNDHKINKVCGVSPVLYAGSVVTGSSQSSPPVRTRSLQGGTVSGVRPYAHITGHQRLSSNKEARQAQPRLAYLGTPPSQGHNIGIPAAPFHPQQNGAPTTAKDNRFSSAGVDARREMPNDRPRAAVENAFKRPKINGDGDSPRGLGRQASLAKPATSRQSQASAPIDISPSVSTSLQGAPGACDSGGTPVPAPQIRPELKPSAKASSYPTPANRSNFKATIEDDEDGDDDDNDGILAEVPPAKCQNSTHERYVLRPRRKRRMV